MVVVSIVVLVGIVFVATSLRQPTVAAYPPSSTTPRPAGDSLAGPLRYTIDASSSDHWRYFSFAQGGLVEPRDRVGWDLAFRRFHIIANGGEGFAGKGGIANLGIVPFESVTAAPAGGYVASTAGKDSANAATARWYRYSFTSHLLKPKGETWMVRTADGRYARMRIVSYYCPGPQPGCVTFEYVYQGDGSRDLAPGPSSSFQPRP